MERDEFLKTLGISLAMVCAGTCLQSCGKGDDDTGTPTPPGGGGGGGGNTASVDVSSMATIGSQTKANGVLFIRTAATNVTASFIATEALCPHQGGNLEWQPANSRIRCDLHFATYSSAGTVTGQPQGTSGGTRDLRIYPVTVSGNTITATKT
ncbi:MAG TPA: Rieske 2Fe-2S domain-containing protein [Pedobacter sp.]|jgi:Rieske Fe-S protein